MVLLLGDENISAPAVHVSGIFLYPLTYLEYVFVLSLLWSWPCGNVVPFS